MSQRERDFAQKTRQIPAEVTPGFAVQAFHKGRKIIDQRWGKTWKYYDLASLTKIIFTVPWTMRAVEEKKISLNQNLSDVLTWYPHKIKIKNLLSHDGGNEWWRPFYEILPVHEPVEARKTELKKILRGLKPKRAVRKAVYSDVDFLQLGFLLEHVFETEWLELWNRGREEMFPKADMVFHPHNQPLHSKNDYAPTEKCPWRKRTAQGEVDDLNAWALGGVAPHAGLFGSMQDVSQWGLWLRDAYLGHKNTGLKKSTVRTFAKRAHSTLVGDWALGFMMPTEGAASCGQYFSPQSIGHTGFTGTSLWYDPKRDLLVVILSNRVHPSRDNVEFRRWRPLIHDWVVESL